MEDEDTGRKDACSYIETTKILADVMTKFLGPNPTRDALGSLGVVPFHQENRSSLP